jgi:hypothetical protein
MDGSCQNFKIGVLSLWCQFFSSEEKNSQITCFFFLSTNSVPKNNNCFGDRSIISFRSVHSTSCLTMMKTAIIVFSLFALGVQGFVGCQNSFRNGRSALAMGDEPRLGETERLLLEHSHRRASGIVQEYGRTVRKDGLDGVRALVWGLFDVTNVAFPMLGVALTMGLFLNMIGYGYYFDQSGFVIDTLNKIQQDQAFQVEAVKMAVEAAEKAALLL